MKKRDSRLETLERDFNVGPEGMKAFLDYWHSFTPERKAGVLRGGYPMVDLPGGRKPLLSYDELPSEEELGGFIEGMTDDQWKRYYKASMEDDLPIDEFYYEEKAKNETTG